MRRLFKISDKDGTNRYNIPLANIEQGIITPFKVKVVPSVGSDGGFDVHGDRQAPQDVGRVSLDFVLRTACALDLQAKIDSFLVGVEGGTRITGLRKLWGYEMLTQQTIRFSFGRPQARSIPSLDTSNWRHVAARAQFLLPDPKFYEALTTKYLTDNGLTATTLTDAVVPEDIAPDFVFQQVTISGTPTNFTITNRGDLVSQHVIFHLDSQASPGFTNPLIVNNTTGQTFSSVTDGSDASTILSFWAAPGLGKVQVSVDAGVNWIDDTPNLSLGATQAVLMELAPGANSFTYTDGGTPNALLQVWYRHAFRE